MGKFLPQQKFTKAKTCFGFEKTQRVFHLLAMFFIIINSENKVYKKSASF